MPYTRPCKQFSGHQYTYLLDCKVWQAFTLGPMLGK